MINNQHSRFVSLLIGTGTGTQGKPKPLTVGDKKNNENNMKNYTLFLIYAIGRDQLGFWVKMEYDLAFEQVNKCYPAFKKWEKRQTDKTDLYNMVERFLFNAMPEEVKI